MINEPKTNGADCSINTEYTDVNWLLLVKITKEFNSNFFETKKKCFKLCGCGSNGKCHYCDSSDFIGYIDGNNLVQVKYGPFETNGISCSSDTIVSLILIYCRKSRLKLWN